MSRAFIIGGLGFVGSHLCDALRAAGHFVAVLDNESQSAVNPSDSTANAAFLNNAEYLDWYNNVHYDYVFHCASPAGPARIAPGYALQPIIQLTKAGLDFAQRVRARFIKMSSSEVYGRADVPLREDTPCIITPPYDARSEYQIGYIAAECLCFNHPHPDVQVLRLFNVVGPRQQASAGVVLPRFCRQALNGEPLTIYGNGTQRRTFTSVSDLVSFCLLLMEKWPSKKGIWNVANPGNSISILHLAVRIIELARDGFVATEYTGLGEHYRDGIEKRNVDISKARSLGWEPRVSLQQIIEQVLKEIRT